MKCGPAEPCFRAKSPKMGLGHRLEENGKTEEQVTDDVGKITGLTVFYLFHQAE